MRRRRMTTRRWMVVVAVAALALALAVVRLRERSLAYRKRAESHAAQAGFRGWVDMGGMYGARLGRLSAEGIAYHAAMARKYRRAARFPWLRVEPDPPEPEWEQE